jgi:hypothetical protein
MSMLLENGEVVPAVTEIEGHVGLTGMLVQRPASMGIHGYLAVDSVGRCQLLDTVGDIAIVGMAVANEQDFNGFNGFHDGRKPPAWNG